VTEDFRGSADSARTADSTPLDHAIEVAAREMTSVDAPGSMRAAVLARIETAPGGFARLPRWAMAGGVAGLALAVAFAVWMMRPVSTPDAVTATQTTPAASPTGGSRPESDSAQTLARLTPVTTGSASVPASGAVRNGAASSGAAAAILAVDGATGRLEMGPPPLAAPAPIVIDALAPVAIAIPEIGIAPLGDLKPITIQDMTTGSTEPQRRQDR
jgi:hypothetical protein